VPAVRGARSTALAPNRTGATRPKSVRLKPATTYD
jgi:hypothetical protein